MCGWERGGTSFPGVMPALLCPAILCSQPRSGRAGGSHRPAPGRGLGRTAGRTGPGTLLHPTLQYRPICRLVTCWCGVCTPGPGWRRPGPQCCTTCRYRAAECTALQGTAGPPGGRTDCVPAGGTASGRNTGCKAFHSLLDFLICDFGQLNKFLD